MICSPLHLMALFKALRKNLKGKAQRGQYLLTVDLGRLQTTSSMYLNTSLNDVCVMWEKWAYWFGGTHGRAKVESQRLNSSKLEEDGFNLVTQLINEKIDWYKKYFWGQRPENLKVWPKKLGFNFNIFPPKLKIKF